MSLGVQTGISFIIQKKGDGRTFSWVITLGGGWTRRRMRMTKKDYIMIAEVIGRVRERGELSALICDFGDALKKDNERFDYYTFSNYAHKVHKEMYGA
jgi:hypothetical protein